MMYMYVEKVVIYRESCIACGACITYCPYGALAPDEEGKPVLIWELCKDDFACVMVCPVAAIKKTSEARKVPPQKWYKVLDPGAVAEADTWLKKSYATLGG